MEMLTTSFRGNFHVFFRVNTWLLYALCMQFLEFPATFLTSLANFCRLVRTHNIAALQNKIQKFTTTAFTHYRFLVALYSIHKSLHGKALCNHRKPISVSGAGGSSIIEIVILLFSSRAKDKFGHLIWLKMLLKCMYDREK